METMFNFPLFFQSTDDAFVLKKMLKHYLDGTLPTVLTAYREHIEEWDGARHAMQQHKTCLRHTCRETDDTTSIAG